LLKVNVVFLSQLSALVVTDRAHNRKLRQIVSNVIFVNFT
jgi:hypothetical protein